MLSADEILAELKGVVAEGGTEITLHQFRAATGITRFQVYDRWGNWTNLRRAAGLAVRNKPVPVYADNELFSAMNAVATQLNWFPNSPDFNRLSVHQEGDRVILRQAGAAREEIELVPPPPPAASPTTRSCASTATNTSSGSCRNRASRSSRWTTAF
jgi:hypothetical protein